MNRIAQALYNQLADREHPSGANHPYAHASEAGHCSRKIAYRLQGVPPSNPYPLTTLISFQIGIALHEQIQAALVQKYPDTRTEVVWFRERVSGHADALYTTPTGVRTVAEIKTASPFAWSYMKEPKREHRLQASLNALALDAPQIHIIYLNIAAKAGTEPLRDFAEPVDEDAAYTEMARLDTIAAATQEGATVAREYEGAILDPEAADYPCSYCPFWDHCRADRR